MAVLRYVTMNKGSAGRVEAVVIQDRELVHRLLPVVRRIAPTGGDVSQGEPYQFVRRVVGREMAACLDDLAHPRVHALDRVGGVDHPPDLRRERKERDHLVPGPPPGSNNGGEFPAPVTLLERIQ